MCAREAIGASSEQLLFMFIMGRKREIGGKSWCSQLLYPGLVKWPRPFQPGCLAFFAIPIRSDAGWGVTYTHLADAGRSDWTHPVTPVHRYRSWEIYFPLLCVYFLFFLNLLPFNSSLGPS